MYFNQKDNKIFVQKKEHLNSVSGRIKDLSEMPIDKFFEIYYKTFGIITAAASLLEYNKYICYIYNNGNTNNSIVVKSPVCPYYVHNMYSNCTKFNFTRNLLSGLFEFITVRASYKKNKNKLCKKLALIEILYENLIINMSEYDKNYFKSAVINGNPYIVMSDYVHLNKLKNK